MDALYFRPHGTVVSAGGYDPITMLYLKPRLEMPAVPEYPSEAEAA